MENHNIQEDIEFDFLKHPDAKELFAPLDYALKNNKHIQKQSVPNGIFSYTRHHFDLLHDYYKNYFGLYFSKEGQDDKQFFFIDFQKDYNGNISRGKIPIENREYLNDEHILIGLLLIRLYIIDFVAEYKHSTSGFITRIMKEYDEYRPELLRLLVDSEETNTTDLEEEIIRAVVDKALKEFHKLGWIELDVEENEFEIMPSCKRLLLIYEDSILNIEQILEQIRTKNND